ncbi:hypothetical protein PVAP13_3NG209042 [Panicum virgatum]|uniref:Uncharacterized protein n=1 Tax=Panicum virgatum TaxID=38727 RepID=A0A8T0UI50_PANVG|nr:hypothetical protein PVAP13_3NG209042 [Panicum virgatum]
MPSRRAQPSPSGHGPALQMDRVILPTTSTIMRLWNLFPPTNTPSTTQRLTNAENPPEDSREEENFDLIKRYQTDPDAPPSSQDYNMDLAASVDQFSKNTAKAPYWAESFSLASHIDPSLCFSSLTSGVQLQWPVFISLVSGGHGSLRISPSRHHSASLHRAAPPHPSVRYGVVGPAPLLSVPNSGGAPLRPLSTPAALPSVPGKLRRRSHPSPTPALLPSAPSVFLPSSPPTRWSGRRRSSPPSPTPAALWMQIRQTAVVRRLTPRACGCEMRRPAVMARMRRPI